MWSWEFDPWISNQVVEPIPMLMKSADVWVDLRFLCKENVVRTELIQKKIQIRFISKLLQFFRFMKCDIHFESKILKIHHGCHMVTMLTNSHAIRTWWAIDWETCRSRPTSWGPPPHDRPGVMKNSQKLEVSYLRTRKNIGIHQMKWFEKPEIRCIPEIKDQKRCELPPVYSSQRKHMLVNNRYMLNIKKTSRIATDMSLALITGHILCNDKRKTAMTGPAF